MLYEHYGEALEEPKFESALGLTMFQLDGVWRARRILDKRGGVIVADEVGLGKTFLAGELIHQAAIERRQKVLVIAPATLRDSTWRPFLKSVNIPADVVSFEEAARDVDDAGATGSRLQSLDSYAMVVVDEAHNLRNGRTLRADAIRKLLAGAVARDLVMLTATPVNNSLLDLSTLISYITPSDSAFVDIDIPSLTEYFGRAINADPDELTSRHLFEVLDAIAVRRTRRFIKNHYPNERVNIGGEWVPVTFPQASVKRVDYDLEAVLPGFFDRFALALGGEDAELSGSAVDMSKPGQTLTMARYVPSRFDKTAARELQFEQQNAGLLRSALLKRFESSTDAFASTLETMMASHEQFLAALKQGKVLTGDALRRWVSADTDDVDEVVGGMGEDELENVAEASDYRADDLKVAVQADLALLGDLREAVGVVDHTSDPKIAALVEQLANVAEEAKGEGVGEADERNRRKVLVFTYYAHTADYIETALKHAIESDARLAVYRDRMVRVTGSDVENRQAAVVGFAPLTAGTAEDEDRFDLAVATDVLAEGVNLQQARHIINYDLPWNPMRLVQRHGRIDRIGSPHDRIFLRCFFPDVGLERLLKLEEVLQRKLRYVAATFGSTQVLPDVEAVDRVIGETRAEIEKLRQEDASLFDDDGSASASSEEYQRRLSRAFESSALRKTVLDMPWGAGSGMIRGADSGIVFCARVADHDRPSFRFVYIDEDGEILREDGKPVVKDELLTCLDTADPRTESMSTDLPVEMRESAQKAWEVARSDIHARWMDLTDPAALQPQVPKAMRDAAELVRVHGSSLGATQDSLVARLNQAVDNRIVSHVRSTLRRHEGDRTSALAALKRLADDLRLPVPEPIAPLPVVALEDVRLICWMAVRGEG